MITGVVNTDILGFSPSRQKSKLGFTANTNSPLFTMKNGGAGFESQLESASSSFQRAQSVANSRNERTLNSLMKFSKQESEVNNLFRDIKFGQSRLKDLENCIKSAESGQFIGAPKMKQVAEGERVDIDRQLVIASNHSTVARQQNIDNALTTQIQQIQQKNLESTNPDGTNNTAPEARDLNTVPKQIQVPPPVPVEQEIADATNEAECERQNIHRENQEYHQEMNNYSQQTDQKEAEYKAIIKDAVALLKADYEYEKAQLTVNEGLHKQQSEKANDARKNLMTDSLFLSKANTDVKSEETRTMGISQLAEKASARAVDEKPDTQKASNPIEVGPKENGPKGKNPFSLAI